MRSFLPRKCLSGWWLKLPRSHETTTRRASMQRASVSDMVRYNLFSSYNLLRFFHFTKVIFIWNKCSTRVEPFRSWDRRITLYKKGISRPKYFLWNFWSLSFYGDSHCHFFHSIISLWLIQSWYSSFILYRLRKACFRWAVSPWRPCSKTCGQGLQYRSVRCMGQTGDGSIVERPNNLCPRDKPSGVQNCIRKACYLNWIVGPWSRVSSRDIDKTCQWFHNCWGVL